MTAKRPGIGHALFTRKCPGYSMTGVEPDRIAATRRTDSPASRAATLHSAAPCCTRLDLRMPTAQHLEQLAGAPRGMEATEFAEQFRQHRPNRGRAEAATSPTPLVERLGLQHSASVRGPGDHAHAESFFHSSKGRGGSWRDVRVRSGPADDVVPLHHLLQPTAATFSAGILITYCLRASVSIEL